MPQRKRKRRRLGESTVPAKRLRAERPNHVWALGPSLLLDVFDAGRRRAQVAAAKAADDEAGARYRGVVLGGFQQVEDNLALLDHLGAAMIDQKAAAAAAQHSLDLAMELYKQGAASYLDVVQAQTAALQAQSEMLNLGTQQLRASVQLIRALGGGWSDEQLVPEAMTGSARALGLDRTTWPNGASEHTQNSPQNAFSHTL